VRSTLSRVPRCQTPPPNTGGLQHYHVSRGSGPRLPRREGFDHATRHTTLNPASLFGRAPVALRVCPPKSGGLRSRHISSSTRPRLPGREGSGAATRPVALSVLWLAILKKCLACLPTLLCVPTHPKVPGARAMRTPPGT
jgi:hypothetical protein